MSEIEKEKLFNYYIRKVNVAMGQQETIKAMIAYKTKK